VLTGSYLCELTASPGIHALEPPSKSVTYSYILSYRASLFDQYQNILLGALTQIVWPVLDPACLDNLISKPIPTPAVDFSSRLLLFAGPAVFHGTQISCRAAEFAVCHRIAACCRKRRIARFLLHLHI